jgi:hypothetical protein
VAKSSAERYGDSLMTLRSKAAASGSVEDAYALYKAKRR